MPQVRRTGTPRARQPKIPPMSTKSARQMRGFFGPVIAGTAAVVTSALTFLPTDWAAVNQEAGVVTIHIGKAVTALFVIVGGSIVGAVGRLRATTRWNGSFR